MNNINDLNESKFTLRCSCPATDTKYSDYRKTVRLYAHKEYKMRKHILFCHLFDVVSGAWIIWQLKTKSALQMKIVNAFYPFSWSIWENTDRAERSDFHTSSKGLFISSVDRVIR